MTIASKCILIVDDYEDIRDSLAAILEGEGCVVVTAQNGREAMKLLEKDKPDLVITDILMPEMDGLELIAEARKIIPEQKFMLISGGGTLFSASDGYDYLAVAKILTGVDTMLRKPFDPGELIKLAKELLAT